MVDFEALRCRLQELAPGDVPRWGRMTAAEAVCHLRDAFAIPLGTRQFASVPTRMPRSLMKMLALRVMSRWPENLPTVPELERGRVAPPGDFWLDRAGALDAFDRFVAAPRLDAAHPMFGRMTTANWHRWCERHMDHHLRQFGH